MQLNTNKSNQGKGKCIKNTFHSINEPLLHIINTCLLEVITSNILKIFTITLVPKLKNSIKAEQKQNQENLNCN